MGTQESVARPTITLGELLAVLELARAHRAAPGPVPASWEAAMTQIRAVVGGQALSARPTGATPPAPGARPERD